MINIIHLLWIVPLSASFGIFIIVLFCGSGNKEYEAYQQGLNDGRKMLSTQKITTFREFFEKTLNSNFSKFKETTDGIIYGLEQSGQTRMIFIDIVDDLSLYYHWEVLDINNEGTYQRPLIKESL